MALRSTNARDSIGSKSITSFSRTKVIVPPEAAGLLAAWAGAVCAGAAAVAAGAGAAAVVAAGFGAALVGLTDVWLAPPPQAAMRPTVPAPNRLVRNSRRVAIRTCDRRAPES